MWEALLDIDNLYWAAKFLFVGSGTAFLILLLLLIFKRGKTIHKVLIGVAGVVMLSVALSILTLMLIVVIIASGPL